MTTRRTNPVRARFVSHTWMMDVSEVPLLLGGRLYVAAVFDAFSRLPLATQVLDCRPTASTMARLLRRAADAFGPPRYVITDRGGEFTGKVFTRAAGRLGARHRLAAADSIHATAMLERFWRTLKETARLRGLSAPLTQHDLERRLELALNYYVFHRPHEGLGGATPAEIARGERPACLAAIEPPRGRAGQDVAGPTFHVEYLDPQGHALPILKRAA